MNTNDIVDLTGIPLDEIDPDAIGDDDLVLVALSNEEMIDFLEWALAQARRTETLQ